ncbi:MAG: late competence development ComFB family protein [Burkholderiaceae bacterium]|jgi:hypothetical protein
MSIEQIHNYYERLVLDEVVRRARELPNATADMVADMACVALNRLPARYVRHDVDLVFYLTEAERHQSDTALLAALDYAEKLVLSRSAEADDDGADGSADAG